MKAKDKTVIVTGAGNGIGRELAIELIHRGATVLAVDINGAALDITISQVEDRNVIFPYVVDISNSDSVEKFRVEVEKSARTVDGLINCAGIIQPFVDFKDMDMPVIDRVMNINFFGNVRMTKAFLPILLNRPEAHIVNISSMGGFFPFPGQSIYGASKAAIKLLSEGLYAELLQSSVKVTLVFPGGVETDIVTNSGLKKNANMEEMQGKIKLLSPRKAAQGIINAMEKDRYQLYLGTDSRLIHFLYTLAPKYFTRMFTKIAAATYATK